jgi:hypothetical protein
MLRRVKRLLRSRMGRINKTTRRAAARVRSSTPVQGVPVQRIPRGSLQRQRVQSKIAESRARVGSREIVGRAHPLRLQGNHVTNHPLTVETHPVIHREKIRIRVELRRIQRPRESQIRPQRRINQVVRASHRARESRQVSVPERRVPRVQRSTTTGMLSNN